MRFHMTSAAAIAMAIVAAGPAFAQDASDPMQEPVPAEEEAAAPPIKVTGSSVIASEYRFRGLTQTDEGPALQATLTVSHESGLYVGAFASNIDDDVSLPGYGSVEIDLYGGFGKTFDNGLGVDVGILYYWYADATEGVNTDFFEPYAAITYALGPVSTKLGVAYAWNGQDGLLTPPGEEGDSNVYGYLDAAIGIPTTPLTVKGHVGYTDGSLGTFNLNALDHSYWDWSVGVEAVGGPLKVGATYVDTDISGFDIPGVGRFDQVTGRGSTVLGYVGFAF